eukprot:8727090-Alexandrium_andersonii.AAC.1
MHRRALRRRAITHGRAARLGQQALQVVNRMPLVGMRLLLLRLLALALARGDHLPENRTIRG